MLLRRFLPVLLVGLFILLSVPYGVHLALIHKVQAATTNITLYANLSGWNYSKPSGGNPTITVTRGDTISFSLIEEPGDIYPPHLFLLDIDNTTTTNDCPNPGPDKCSTVITPTQSPTIAPFTVSFATGTYMYYCTYHSPPYMTGKFVVKESTTPDFKIDLSSPSLTVTPGSSRTVTVTLTSASGFSGTVSLTATLSSPGPQVTFSPTSVTLSSSGPASSTLSVSAASSEAYSTPVPQGNYQVNVTGTSGSLVHSTTLALTVGSSSGAGALPTSAIIGAGVASAVAIVAAIVYLLRRRPKARV